MSQIYDTIILGAGWAGAVAARELSSKGHSVLVLEARDRIGGRAQTWVGGGAKIDVGCSWIHGYKEGNPARKIAKDFGVQAHLPKPAEGVIYGPTGPLSKSDAEALRANLGAAQAALKLPHPAPSPSTSLASGLFAASSPLFGESKAPANPDDSTATATNPSDPSSTDVKASPSGNINGKLAQDFARMLEVPLGLKLEKASLKWAGWESTTNFAGSDAAPEGGYEALVGKVFDDATGKGAQVKLNAVVSGVKECESSVAVSTKDGQTYSGKTVISTIPLGTLKALSGDFFNPALPAALTEVIHGTHVGVLEKLLLQYPSAWWPQAETVGSYTFLPTSDASSLSPTSSADEVFAASTLICANFACPTLPGSTPTLLTYLSETPATLLAEQDPKAVAAAYHRSLVQRFQPSSAPPEPSASSLTNWLTDEFSRGATTTPSIVSENGERSPMDFKELSRPVWAGKLGFAGEHTEMENRGSVAGAVLSGYREADRVDRLLVVLSGKE